MPIYEYRCTACNKNFEVVQKISEPHVASCPRCGKKAKRLISRTSFTLKGSGWYKDGYASGAAQAPDKPQAARADGKKPEKPEKSETKADTATSKKE